MRRPALQDALVTVGAGVALYGAAAGLETVSGVGLAVSAILEELLKVAVLLVFGWTGRRAMGEGETRRLARSRALGLARGLSLGLVTVTVFAGAENLAYLAAFPEAGVLARLVWSLPVHLVAALTEALGILCLFRWRRAGVAFLLGLAALAMAWHATANLLASHQLAFPVFAGGVVAANLLFLVLLSQFLRHAYLGGFLHGAD